MNVAEHYTYRVRWSEEDGEFVGTVAEFPSLSWLAASREEAFEGIVRLATETVEEMQASGERPPAAVADRDFSGKFVVRVPPEVHRDLAFEAAEQGVSLNRLVAARLRGRRKAARTKD